MWQAFFVCALPPASLSGGVQQTQTNLLPQFAIYFANAFLFLLIIIPFGYRRSEKYFILSCLTLLPAEP